MSGGERDESLGSVLTALGANTAIAITSTATPAQNASSPRGFTSARTPSQIETAPPTTNIPMAASSAQ